MSELFRSTEASMANSPQSSSATTAAPRMLEFAGAPGFMRHLQSRLPLYKKWFVEAAEQSSQDWRLLAAIGYQESKWNPSAASSARAPRGSCS